MVNLVERGAPTAFALNPEMDSSLSVEGSYSQSLGVNRYGEGENSGYPGVPLPCRNHSRKSSLAPPPTPPQLLS